MTQLLNVETERRDKVLTEAADRHVLVVLSHRLDSGWATYKSRFLQADSAGRFLIIEHPLQVPDQPPPELVPGEKIGLSFRRGHKKCMFEGEISRLTTFDVGNGQALPALMVPWPDNLQEMQRRLYYRADVPSGRRIEVCMWHGCALDSHPSDLNKQPHHVGMLQDVSAGGCRVLIDAARDPHLEAGDTIGIQFQPDPRSEPLRLDAMFRHREELDRGKVQLGFQFVGLEMGPQGRRMLQALTRVVSTFLRIKARREKMRLQRNRRRRQ